MLRRHNLIYHDINTGDQPFKMFDQLLGLLLLSLSIWTMEDKTFLEELLRNRLFMDTTYTLLLASSLLSLLSCFGVFAALREIKCFLLSYFVMLLLLSVTLLVGGALAYVFREQVSSLAPAPAP